jgi:DNA-binding LytR/AlgR family response regulator
MWIEVRTRVGNKYIPVDKVNYIKANDKYSTIYFEDLTSLKTHHLLKWYLNKLPVPNFIRCHNSYVINCMNIDFYCGTLITLKGNTRIPLSRKKKSLFRNSLELLHNRKHNII